MAGSEPAGNATYSFTPDLGEIFKAFRESQGLTQAQLAGALHVDQSYVSKIERGRPVRDIDFLQRVARLMAVPPSQLGLSNELTRSVNLLAGQPTQQPNRSVDASQDRWRATRTHLAQNRLALGEIAAGLYGDDCRMGAATFLAPDSWRLDSPVPLQNIELTWAEGRRPKITGREPETQPFRPLRSPGHQYDRYTAAIGYLARPSLFENRPSYRLTDIEWNAESARFSFGLGMYFDKLDVAESLAHELAAFHKDERRIPEWHDLPFRSLVGDPFDLRRRLVAPAITTLTLTRDTRTGNATFLLHWRDPAKVATGAGLCHLIPAGEFQPSSLGQADVHNDLYLWRNIVREFSEELLGEPEHDGTRSEPINYESWPLYRTLTDARTDGKLRTFCLGMGLEALTLSMDILTVVAIDDDVFDDTFGEPVEVNAEGMTIFGDDPSKRGIPFTEPEVRRILTEERLASPAAACLELAWRHRVALLA